MGSIADQEKLIEGIIWNEDYAVSKEVPWSQGSVSEKVMKMMFDDFCECLKLFDLPDLVPVRRAGLPEGPCIVVFGPPSERLSLLLAMNRLVPGCGHLVFSADWVSVDDRGHGNLKKGVTCDHLGKTTFVEYTSPPTITYLINMNTAPIVFGMGELSGPVSEYGRLADAMNCPRSSGDALEPLVADKLHTRLLAAGSGVLVPGGMAFVMDPAPYQGLPVPDGIEILSLQNITDADVATHLERLPYQRFVIKPSGPLWMQSMGVSFHDKTDLPAAVDAFRALVSKLNEGDTILVDEMCGAVLSSRHGGLGARFRVMVARRPTGPAEMTGCFCTLGWVKSPINGDTSEVFQLPELLDMLGVSKEDAKRIEKDVNEAGRRTLQALADWEDARPDVTRNRQEGTDLIGVDLLLTQREGQLVPVMIEVNDHDCTAALQTWEASHGPVSHALDLFAERMLHRSYCYLLRDQCVVLIGGGGFSKKNTFDHLAHLGLRVVMVEPDPEHFGKSLVNDFVHYDFDDHRKDEEHAKNIAVIVKEFNPKAVITFWEDNGPLTALICNKLGLKGNSPEAARTAKSKYATQACLAAEKKLRFLPGDVFLGLRSSELKSKSDIDSIPANSFPMFLKYDTGSSAWGVQMTPTAEDMKEVYDTWRGDIEGSQYGGVGLGFDGKLIAQEAAVGSEHDVDLVLQDGRLVTAFVTDNGPTGGRYSRELSAAMPSVKSKDNQLLLIRSAVRACRLCGLTTGPFNVELMMTIHGVKVIEINGRMGGFYISRWINEIYDVDLVMLAVVCGAGLAAYARSAVRPRYQYLSFMCYPSLHRDLVDFTTLQALAVTQPFVHPVVMEEHIEKEDLEYEEPYAAVGVRAETYQEAFARMSSLVAHLGVWQREFDFISKAPGAYLAPGASGGPGVVCGLIQSPTPKPAKDPVEGVPIEPHFVV
eukprot:Hpha_TRINITY_DN16052_c1_g6::TRINITY_DN16052_c1_g6_i2::g.119383::m.119383/K14755/CRNS1, ATPGD1; carnosine synthase